MLRKGERNNRGNMAVPFTSFCKHCSAPGFSLNNYLLNPNTWCNWRNNESLKTHRPKTRCVLSQQLCFRAVWNEWKWVWRILTAFINSLTLPHITIMKKKKKPLRRILLKMIWRQKKAPRVGRNWKFDHWKKGSTLEEVQSYTAFSLRVLPV